VLEAAQDMDFGSSRVVRLGLPTDRFIAHGSRAGQLAECGIDATGIAATVQRLIESPVAVEAEAEATLLNARALLSR